MDSKTAKNLLEAFAGESMAFTKYNFFAEKALKDGYVQISNIFKQTANNEKEHAEIWYELLNGEIKDTKENLEIAASGEEYENNIMYKEFAKVANEEGYDEIAFLFDEVAEIEKSHMMRFQALLNNINNGQVFQKPGQVVWECLNCGHLHVGQSAPIQCPVCGYKQGYFQLRSLNY